MVALDADTGQDEMVFPVHAARRHATGMRWRFPVLVDAHVAGPAAQTAGAGQSQRVLLCARPDVTGKFLHGTPFVKSLNWATGLTPEGRPIGSRRRAQLCRARRCARRHRAPPTGCHQPITPTPDCFMWRRRRAAASTRNRSRQFRPGGFPFNATGYVESPEEPRQLYVRALELDHGKAEMGVQADRVEGVWRGPALHRGIAGFRRRRSGDLHRAGRKDRASRSGTSIPASRFPRRR